MRVLYQPCLRSRALHRQQVAEKVRSSEPVNNRQFCTLQAAYACFGGWKHIEGKS